MDTFGSIRRHLYQQKGLSPPPRVRRPSSRLFLFLCSTINTPGINTAERTCVRLNTIIVDPGIVQRAQRTRRDRPVDGAQSASLVVLNLRTLGASRLRSISRRSLSIVSTTACFSSSPIVVFVAPPM